ncbi:hypothetical protein EJ08DRAFT_648847 [Tothia fuscella]|uniref:Autophagy-related protein 27 n=1 Tax=Tothia fuscella TaxID=1048955 RepID=A0A9P4NUC2_9PEZI|nr:hypothetical protein EJ08DRAFT_648847 [Tothia fuscella]
MPGSQLPFSLLRSAALISLSLPTLITASIGFDCSNIVHEKTRWNLEALGGPRVVHWIREGDPTTHNFTFTLDICKPLLKEKGLPDKEQCASSTRICGVDRAYNPIENVTTVDKKVDIVGDYFTGRGLHLESVVTRLSTSPRSDQEGIRAELSGGRYPLDDKKGKKQKAIIDFLCDKDVDGTETETPDGKDEKEEKSPEKREEKNESPLVFKSYAEEKVPKSDDMWEILRLEWTTKYACEDSVDVDKPVRGSWGFFTWFIIILFLAVAAYLIFGSWLNYNRYGARGWDLVPHGEAIRDIPYIVKDLGRKVASTVQGPNSRGGYSAV